MAADRTGRIVATTVEENLVGGVASSLSLRSFLTRDLTVTVSVAVSGEVSTSAKSSDMIARTPTAIVVGVWDNGEVAGCYHGYTSDSVSLSIRP